MSNLLLLQEYEKILVGLGGTIGKSEHETRYRFAEWLDKAAQPQNALDPATPEVSSASNETPGK